MWDIPDKVANNGASVAGKHLHSEFNNRQHEVEKVVTSTGMALTAYPIDPNSTADPNETMLAEAISRLVSLGIAGTDSGVANAYVLSAIGDTVVPKTLFDGMIVVTEPSATNTGASTANVFGLGIKALRTYSDAALVGGEVVLGRPTAWRYKAAAAGGAGAWLILPWADAAGATSSGAGRNRLINARFVFNRRSQVSGVALTAGKYGHDRWKAGSGGCTYTFATAGGVTTITVTAGTLVQVVEASGIEGGTYTLSWTGTAQARIWQGAAAGAYASSPVTITGLAAATATAVEFSAGTLAKVQLEPGPSASSIEYVDPAVELLRCMRYFQYSGSWTGGWVSSIANVLYVTGLHPVEMRTVPTVVLKNGTGTAVRIGDYGYNIASINSSAITERGGWIGLNTTGVATAAWLGTLSLAALSFEAEL